MIKLSIPSRIMAILFFCTTLLLFSGNVLSLGHGERSGDKAMEGAYLVAEADDVKKDKNGVKVSIPDLVLLNQEGKKIRFYSDLVKDKVVAINFIFTTCTTACPLLSATFSNVQELMGDRFGRDVYLISISVDPVIDTPERLKAMATKFHARPGWTFVTGEREEIVKLLRALGASALRKKDHTPLVLIGNDTRGTWTRTNGLAQPIHLARLIDGMMNGVIE